MNRIGLALSGGGFRATLYHLGVLRLVTDTRIIDMRAWRPGSKDPEHRAISYRRMLVRRLAEETEDKVPLRNEAGRFRLQQFHPNRDFLARCDAENLDPVVRITSDTSPSGERGFTLEAEFDLSSVALGQDFDVGFEISTWEIQGRSDNEERLTFPIIAPTNLATLWVLLPSGRPYQEFQLTAYDRAAPARVESIEPTYDFRMADGSLFGWMVVAPEDSFVYECTWTWRDE